MTSDLSWMAPLMRRPVHTAFGDLVMRQTSHPRPQWWQSPVALRHTHSDLVRTYGAKIQRMSSACGAALEDVRNVLIQTLARAGSAALFNPETVDGVDEHLIESHPEAAHIIGALVLCANSDNPYARNVLQTDNGRSALEAYGYEEYEDEDGDTRWAASDDLCTCEGCGGRLLSGDAFYVHTDNDPDDGTTDSWHEHCARDSRYVVRCSITGYWVDNRSVDVAEVDGRAVWQALCEANGEIHYSERHDCWLRGSEDPDEEEELAGYHSVYRSWESKPCTTQGYVGVELELGFPDGDRSEFLEAFTDGGRFTDGRPFIIERDGSLDSIPEGCELISSPLPLYEGYQSPKAPWRSVLRDLHDYGAAGWQYRKYAGLHVNLCVTGEADDTVMKYAIFINTARAMSCFIAGRKKLYGRDDLRGGYDTYTHALLKQTPRSAFGTVYGRGKYSAVNRRNADCLETRIFGSNLRYEGFMAAVEYCVAVMAYARIVDVWQVASPIAAAEFRGWLGTQVKRFPNLCARLGIIVHDPSHAIPSTAKLVPILAAA